MNKKILIAVVLVVLFFPTVRLQAHSVEIDFYEIFEQNGSIMLLIDAPSGEIVHGNKAASEFYGYTIEQLESMNIAAINVMDVQEIQGRMEEANSERLSSVLMEQRLSNGDIRKVRIYASPYTYEGQTLHLAIMNDVTGHFLAAEQNRRNTNIFIATSLFMIIALLLLSLLLLNSLRISKAQSREIRDFSILRQTFIDADCNFVWLKDQHLRYVFANKAAASFHHRSIEEMVGCTDSELVDEQIAVSRERVDRQVLSKKAAVSEEYPYGNQVFKATKFPVSLSHDQWGVGAYIRDITGEYNSKKQMEKTLHRNEILVQMMNQEYNSAQDHLDHVLNESLKLTESEYGYIYVYEEESEEFILNSWSDKVLDDCAILNPGRRQKLSLAGLWGEVVRQRQPIIVNDFSQSHLRKKGHPTGHIRLSKFMSVPIIIDGKIIAVVGLANKKENYDNNDVLQISGLMHGVWNSIERKAHRKGLEEANRILSESEVQSITLISHDLAVFSQTA